MLHRGYMGILGLGLVGNEGICYIGVIWGFWV